jgi:hypothetical protein
MTVLTKNEEAVLAWIDHVCEMRAAYSTRTINALLKKKCLRERGKIGQLSVTAVGRRLITLKAKLAAIDELYKLNAD